MLKIQRLGKSFSYAFRGLSRTFREEQSLQVQSLVAIMVLVLAALVGISPTEWCFIITVIILVFLIEIINSAVERIADALKPRIHEYIKEVKDIMAAAVMLSSFLAISVGLIIFVPYLMR